MLIFLDIVEDQFSRFAADVSYSASAIMRAPLAHNDIFHKFCPHKLEVINNGP